MRPAAGQHKCLAICWVQAAAAAAMPHRPEAAQSSDSACAGHMLCRIESGLQHLDRALATQREDSYSSVRPALTSELCTVTCPARVAIWLSLSSKGCCSWCTRRIVGQLFADFTQMPALWQHRAAEASGKSTRHTSMTTASCKMRNSTLKWHAYGGLL